MTLRVPSHRLNAADWAEIYRAAGYCPVRIPPGVKRPNEVGWVERALANTETFASSDNVGLLLGVDNLVDVDLDSTEALAIADRFLPETQAVFGRKSKPESHHLFRSLSRAIRKHAFEDPLRKKASAPSQKRNGTPADPEKTTEEDTDHKYTLVESRGVTKDGRPGHQTLAPGSVHPSGEAVEWQGCTDGEVPEPALVDADDLERSVKQIAAASLIMRYWPKRQSQSRHETMLALIGALAHAGWTEKEALRFCQAVADTAATSDAQHAAQVPANVTDTFREMREGRPYTGLPRLADLLPPEVVHQIAVWLQLPQSQVGSQTGQTPDPAKLSEEKMAQRFEARYRGAVLYDHDLCRWFVWDENAGVWRCDDTRSVFHFVREICRKCNKIEAKEFARANTYAGVERICQNSSVFATTTNRWNQDPWLLGVPGGTIDLRTGALRDPRREDYISKQTAVAPDWKLSKPVFDNFLNECTRGDKALQRYLKRLAGYALTGSTREEVLIFIFGPGGNGKTKLVRTFAGIMCDYARQAPMDAFVVKRGERHSTDIAGLRDARLVTAAETEDGRRWDEALIKQLTGGDEVTARLMRQDNRSYIPQFKLLIVGNHAPDLTNVDASTRRRFRIVPFTFVPVVPDDHLLDKLRAERPAILAWMIDGGREWYQEGLGPTPACVLKETEEYFERPRPREAMDWRVLPARSESYIAYIAVNEKSAEK